MNILFYGDWAPTGYGRVSRAFVKHLVAQGERVTVLGTNYYGKPYGVDIKATVLPAQDPRSEPEWMGRRTLLKTLANSKGIQLVIIFQDPYFFSDFADDGLTWAQAIRDACTQQGTKILHYFPTDCPIPSKWLELARLADRAATYNTWSVEQIRKVDAGLAARTSVIPHGIDEAWMAPPRDESAVRGIRSRLLQPGKRFLGMCLNANTPRKDWSRTTQIVAEVIRRRPEVAFYFHTDHSKGLTGQGAEPFLETAVHLGLQPGYDLCYPPHDEWHIREAELAQRYQAADFYLTCSAGEGFGFAPLEAALCKVPVVLPRTTAYSSWPEDGCYAIPAGHDLDHMQVILCAGEAPRPIVSVQGGVDAVLRCLADLEAGHNPTVSSAQAYAQAFTWPQACIALEDAIRKAFGV